MLKKVSSYVGFSTLMDVTVAMKQRWKRRSGSGCWLSQSSLPLTKCFLRPCGPAGVLLWLAPAPCWLMMASGKMKKRKLELGFSMKYILLLLQQIYQSNLTHLSLNGILWGTCTKTWFIMRKRQACPWHKWLKASSLGVILKKWDPHTFKLCFTK